jgi:pantothenate kinase
MEHGTLPAAALQRAQALLAAGGRRVLGIAAPPGAGKSTLAAQLVQALGPLAQVVPMDGFHLANSELQRLGRAERKGAPDTFDALGYVHLLRRIRAQQPGETIYAPEFRRELEEGISGVVAVRSDTRLIITEGNYLLLATSPWDAVRDLLDEAWYLALEDDGRQRRLLERHMRFGRERADALRWIAITDEPNARLVAASRHRADWVLEQAA